MKKFFTVILAAATTVAAFADRPLLVGHRGSLYGVENSVESFTNGAKLGYEFLETDFKVTKDKQLVCSHDDDISRLSSDGSSLAIASNTLADLQSHPFAQTRSGVRYTGRLCSAQEYLDVCKEYNVRPLIELKWATGINSNDCSNIPMLIKFIEDNGFRDKCIILTSMKPCLEYIRRNYPDIELQFLTGEYWASHFDWCVAQGIDVDIQAGYFDKATVTKYHDKGLKVNVWTANDNTKYQQYGNWGCDFITTDYLDPTKLPELDSSVTFPPNTVDYPNAEGTVRGFYASEQIAEFDTPADFSGRTIRKALFKNNEWVVLSFVNDADARVDIVDPSTGNITGQYSLAGIDNPGDIAFTADGILIVSNETTVAHLGTSGVEPTGTFRLYRIDSKSAAPVEFFNTNTAADLGNWSNSRAGRHIAVSGRMDDLKVYVSTWSSSGETTRLVGFYFEKNKLTQKAYDLEGKWSKEYTMTVSPTSRDCIIVDNPTMAPVEYKFVWGDRVTLEQYSEFKSGIMTDAADGMSFYRRAAKVYGVMPTTAADGSAYTATVYDATDGMAALVPVSDKLHDGLGSTAAGYAATAIVAGNDDNIYVHLFTLNGGMASFALATKDVVETPAEVDLELKRDWIFSVSTDNDPGDIDGTNAQQGTAVNGYFYINNCVEKKLHIFNETGHIGSIPGGAGWGCARDDAGNIVIRDDKDTGTSHKFIVYPAGATPDSYREPVTFTANVVYSGQTNFINAGGDLLNGTGHIYLFPNAQAAVNIITVTNGQVTGCKGYNELSLTGSTAGYVIPINDDTENWLYHVRSTGFYQYNGGTSSSFDTARTGTTAPSRNSTCGGAYFKISGNEIYIHNSGTNYVGGFTVRNLTTNEVVANIDPIGNKGYTSGGNYSVSNWTIPERVSDGVYNLYQYCPANGIAKYTLTDKKNTTNGVDNVSAETTETIGIAADSNTLTVNGTDVTSLRVYNLAGVLVASSNAASADISSLTAGMYIVNVNNTTSRKFMKK